MHYARDCKQRKLRKEKTGNKEEKSVAYNVQDGQSPAQLHMRERD